MSNIRQTPNSNVQSVTINYTSSATGQNPQLQIFNSPGGSNSQVQFNAGNGKFAGSPNMVWNNANRILNVLGTVRASNLQGKLTTNLLNLKITGGNAGDTLTTDGTGNLTWVEGENYTNVNVASFLVSYTGNITANNLVISNTFTVNATSTTRSINANGNVTANFFIGNGSLLTGLPAQYANSNVANYLPTFTGNISAGNANLGNAVLSNYFVGNGSLLTGFGNISTINLNGNSNTVLYGNGVFGAINSGGATDELVNGDNSFVLDNDGNVVFQGAAPGQGVDRGLVWDYGVEQDGVNSQVRQDNDGITVRSWTVDGGNYSSPVNIVTNQDANINRWIFDGQGNLTLPGSLISSGNIESLSNGIPFSSGIVGVNSGNANVIITLADNVFDDPYTGLVTISGVNPPVQVNGNWYYLAVNFNEFQLFNDANLTSPVDGSSWPGYVDGGTAVGFKDYANLNIQGGNVFVKSNDYTWTFDTTGKLTLPQGSKIVELGTGMVELTAGAGNDSYASLASFNANSYMWVDNTAAYIGTDWTGNIKTWIFNGDGNLTLPGNTFSVKYANGNPVSIGSGGGIIFEYEIANFTANAIPAVGTMQFTNRLGEVVTPDNGTRLFINTQDGTGQQTGSIWRGLANDSGRATLTLQLNANQQPFRVANMGVYLAPETYRGYRAGVNQIWGDDCSINQIIITNASNPVFYNPNFDLEEDVFHATNLGDASVVYMVNVYGNTQEFPLNEAQVYNFFVSFVDNVIYQSTNTETQDAAEIKDAFYTNFSNFRNSINSDAYFRNFEFSDNTTYYYSAGVNGGSGTNGSLRVRLNADQTYTILGVNQAGTGYQVGNELTVPGTSLGGVSPDNDLVVDCATVDGSGGITAVSYMSGIAAFPWPSNNISDGGDDQYDNANYINTNLDTEINYGGGNVTAGDAQFGVGSEYVTMYNNSIFCFVATGVDIIDLFYSGNLGSDGDGFIRWTGINGTLTPDIIYAYMQCQIGTGTLEPQEGLTYQVALDSDGINLDQFYSYFNDNTNDWYFGADKDWRLESKQELFVQSYQNLNIRTLVPTDATEVNAPSLTIQTAQGSDASAQYNISAGSGGVLEIYAGSGGSNDGVPGLGGYGGSIEMIAGDSSGTDQNGGTILIRSGSSPNGSGGNIQIQASGGNVGNGIIELRTTSYGVEDRLWIFNSKGSVVFPTLTVDLHNGGNQQAQTLQFGNPDLQAVITGPTPNVDVSAQRLIIQGQRGNGTGEGGDVYLWAGDADTNGGDIKIYAGDADVSGYGGYINLDGGSGVNGGGQLTLTGGYSSGGQGGPITITPGYSGDADGAALTLNGGQAVGNGGNVNITAGFGQANGGHVNITGGQSALGLPGYGNVYITAGATSWAFDNSGNLTLPTNSFNVNYANGIPVTFGGAALGNVTFSNITIQGVGNEFGGDGLYLSPDPNLTANLQYFRIRGGDDPTHLHFDTGNNTAYDQYFGDDNKYLKLEKGLAGNIKIGTYQDGGVGQLEWIFDSNGNLVLAGGNSVIQSIANSSLDPLNPNVSTMVLTPDANYYNQALVLDPTAPGHIHLRAPGGNIDEPVANLFLGGENSSFEVGYYTGSAPNVFIHSNNYTWTFDNSGSLSFPRDVGGNTDPYLFISGGANPAISSVDVSLAGPANLAIVSNSLNLSGYTGAKVSIYADDGEVATDDIMVLTTNNANVGNTYSWTFDTDGTLTVPGDITGSGASPAPSLSGFNSLGAVSLSVTGTGTAINASSGNILTNEVTGTKFKFLNGSHTATLTGSGANANYQLNLPANAGINGQVLSTDGSGNLSWINLGAGSNISNGNSNVVVNANSNVVISTNGNAAVIDIGADGRVRMLTGQKQIGGNIANSEGYIQFSTGSLTYFGGNIQFLSGGYIKGPAGTNVLQMNSPENSSLRVVGNLAVGASNTGAIYGGNATLFGTIITGVNSILAGPTFTPLPNTMAGFVSNVNSYTQLTIQNKSTGADATTDFIATADNGSDTVNYLDLGIINSGYDTNTPTNSLGNIVFAADSYLYAQGNVGNTSQSGGNLAIGTTVAGKSVKIFSGGANSNAIVGTFSNTGLAVNGNVTANNFSGNISITGNVTGTSPNVTLVAGSYSYIFDNAGTLTVPAGSGSGGGNEGGQINFAAATANTTMTGPISIDIYQDKMRFFETAGTNRGVYLDLSQAATSVGTLLNNRVSGFVNAGTYVTMDNIKATVTTTGNRGLSIATVTGTFSYNVSGTFGYVSGVGGSSANGQTATTTGSGSIFNWGFPSTGDAATYIITDTTNSRCYRITMMIGASYNNNMISIERLI